MNFKLFSFLLLASCVSIASEQQSRLPSNAYVITNDGGGVMENYRARALRLAKNKRKVVIRGACASACTLLFQSHYNLDVCAVQGAMLYFHMPYFISPSTGEMIINEHNITRSEIDWNNEWLGHFGANLNSILQRATNLGHIPNPTALGDPNAHFSFPATLAFPEC